MNYLVVIPARYASTRLPAKPLLPIAGVPMLVRTWQRCIQAVDPQRVWVATDDDRIAQVCSANGIQWRMTSPECLTGTDRVAEFARSVPADTYINVQGDEPLFNPDDLRLIVDAAAEYPRDVLNGYCPIQSEEEFFSSAVPKVVFRPDGRLLYMSRAGIPGNKTQRFRQGYRQVCAYAFPADALQRFARLTQKTPLEEHEDIEILRFVEMGFEVRMLAMSTGSIAVDLPADISRVEQRLLQEGDISP